MARRRRRPSSSELPEQPSWTIPIALGVLAVSGATLIGYGLMTSPKGSAPTEQPAVEQAAGGGPSGLPDIAPVQSGSGVFTNDAPAATEASSDEALCAGCDVVLVTLCSLRKDHVGVYGDHAELTPWLDRIADGGYHFERAYSASNFTLAGLSAVLTSRFGSATGMLGWNKGLPEGIVTLPEVLGHYGYTTAGFTIDAPSGFRPDYGLDRGFQHMSIVPPPRDTPDGRNQGGAIGPGGASARPAAEWLVKQPADKPLFLMFHSRTAHFPFTIEEPTEANDPTGMARKLWESGQEEAQQRDPNAPMPGMAGGTAQAGIVALRGPDPLQVHVNQVGEPAVKEWRRLYAESVAWMDKDLEVLWQALEQRGRLDRTLIIAVADHGESLNDQGELLHGDAYFDTVVNVPLLMKVPGLSGQSEGLDALVGHVDILPTVLEAVGAKAPAGIDGRSILPLLKGEADEVRGATLSEGGVAFMKGDHPSGAIFSPPWALLRQQRGCGPTSDAGPPRQPGEPGTCLFHMDDDPQQLNSVARQNPEVVAELMELWEGYREHHGNRGQELELSPEFVDELRRTGYDFRMPEGE